MGINLALRPVSRYVDRKSLARLDTSTIYRIGILCRKRRDHEVRDVLLRFMAERPLTLRDLRTEDAGDGNEIYTHASVESSTREKGLIEDLTVRLRALEGVSQVEWAETAGETE
jgi:uncharacterized membrane protein YhiD involved in acid resistance